MISRIVSSVAAVYFLAPRRPVGWSPALLCRFKRLILGIGSGGSFDAATDRAVDLTTAIRPKSAQPLPGTIDVDHLDMPESSWAGVRFDAPVKSRYHANDLIRLSGKVTARLEGSFGVGAFEDAIKTAL